MEVGGVNQLLREDSGSGHGKADDDDGMLGVRNCRRAPLYLRVPRSENSEGNFLRPLCSAKVGERCKLSVLGCLRILLQARDNADEGSHRSGGSQTSIRAGRAPVGIVTPECLRSSATSACWRRTPWISTSARSPVEALSSSSLTTCRSVGSPATLSRRLCHAPTLAEALPFFMVEMSCCCKKAVESSPPMSSSEELCLIPPLLASVPRAEATHS